MRARVHDLRDGHALPPRLFLRGELRPLLAGAGGRVGHLAGAAKRCRAAPRLPAWRRRPSAVSFFGVARRASASALVSLRYQLCLCHFSEGSSLLHLFQAALP